MINNAIVTVQNQSKDKTLRVVRKPKANSDADLDKTLAVNGRESIDLLSTDVELVIHSPGGLDLKKCWIKVYTGVDLDLRHSRTDSAWIFKIIPNDLDPDVPTTVNISVGSIEPP
jgi:hypothetical protein